MLLTGWFRQDEHASPHQYLRRAVGSEEPFYDGHSTENKRLGQVLAARKKIGRSSELVADDFQIGSPEQLQHIWNYPLVKVAARMLKPIPYSTQAVHELQRWRLLRGLLTVQKSRCAKPQRGRRKDWEHAQAGRT
jgi:hypothetical protein